jgi:LysR family hydrogen peroxide-inducible transcriptional activator
MPITLRQLRYLEALAREGHFGRAAERSAISQPALSAQIRDLETDLGVTLAERTPSGARLTAVGAEIVRRARVILAEVADLETYARAQSGLMAGPLRLGVIPSIAPYLLPRLLPQVATAYPGLSLSIRETITATLEQELADGAIDAAIASLPFGRGAFSEQPLFDDAFLLATPERGPYALVDVTSAGDIPAEALLLLEDGHCLRDQTLAVCGALDGKRLRASGVTSLSTILQLVSAGQGVTLLPELFLATAPLPGGGIRLARFGEPEPRRTIGLAWRKRHPMAEDFGRLAGLISGDGGPDGRAVPAPEAIP